MLTSQSGILDLNLLEGSTKTASEVELKKERDRIGPDKLQEDRCNSVSDGSLFSIPIQPDPNIERSTASITRCFRERLDLLVEP